MHDEESVEDKAKKDLAHYRTVLQFMGANVPIQVLCLPPEIENVLLRDECVRVYDLLGRDLSMIKGIGNRRLNLLRSRLDEFFAVNL